MRRNVWLATALVVLFTLVFCAASCTKKVVQTEPVPTAQSGAPTASERSVGESTQAAPEQENRPGVESLAREAAGRAFVNENVHFEFDSFALSEKARQILTAKAYYMRTDPGIRVTVEGHCDDRGTGAYNIALGERRAESVKQFLVSLGIGADRLNTISYGKERPVAQGQNEVSWAKNRRVQFVIN
jgi:peptidoglycan-associated lipoprotein